MSKNLKIISSFIILLIGLLLISSEYLKSKKIQVYDYMNELYYEEIVDLNEDEIKETEEINVPEEIMNNEEEVVEDTNYEFINNIDNKSIYIGYLNIPKINLKKGFTEIESKYNEVSKNIQILNSSDYPDQINGNVILAAHSGNSSVSYFNKLYLLNKDDVVYIEYNNKKYTYKITNIYTVEKTGKVEIKRNKDISTLTLITCTKNDNTTQTVYICDLINEE